MPDSNSNPTTRFSSRVADYVKYRPGYPDTLLDLLRKECNLTINSIIADIGSGTGKLTELFLKNGNPVFGIEPNLERREAGERLLKPFTSFTSIAATAEATTLPSQSVDFITAGQAFHWFKRDLARQEFIRILKPGGWTVLIWNDRHTMASPFLEAYEELLRNCSTDYRAVDHKNVDATVIASFFGRGGFNRAMFPNDQSFDLAGLQGRLMSSSYAPESSHPNHIPMLNELSAIFQRHQSNGQVVFKYDTLVYFGQLST